MVDAGLTVAVVPTNPPGFQVYVLAPVPVNTDEKVGHIAVGLAVAPTMGLGLTVTFACAVLLQPAVLPVSV